MSPHVNAPPLPVLASPEILDATDSEVGDRFNLGMSTFALPVQIVGVAEFFPTVDPREQPFVVADLGELVDYSNRHGRRIFAAPANSGLTGTFYREIWPAVRLKQTARSKRSANWE